MNPAFGGYSGPAGPAGPLFVMSTKLRWLSMKFRLLPPSLGEPLTVPGVVIGTITGCGTVIPGTPGTPKTGGFLIGWQGGHGLGAGHGLDLGQGLQHDLQYYSEKANSSLKSSCASLFSFSAGLSSS